ncbi:MAG: hypothetical protein ACREEB_11115 [Caulobacteraceae bacterium]
MTILLTMGAGALALSALAAPGPRSLPLRRGVYVVGSAECVGASSASKAWFGGGVMIHQPHASCDLVQASRTGPMTWEIAKRCFEYGNHARPFAVVDRIRIVSHTEYELNNRFGRFDAHWCHG